MNSQPVKPLKSKTFFLDLSNYPNSIKLAGDLELLGAKEVFSIPSASFVVSDRPSVKSDANLPTPFPRSNSPLFRDSQLSVNLCSVNSPVERVHSPCIEPKSLERLKPMSRGMSMLLKASEKTQNNKKDVIELCKRWKVKIYSVSKVVQYIEKYKSTYLRINTAKRKLELPSVGVQKIAPPFIKVEDSKRQFRPKYKALYSSNIVDSSLFRSVKALVKNSKQSSGVKDPHRPVLQERIVMSQVWKNESTMTVAAASMSKVQGYNSVSNSVSMSIRATPNTAKGEKKNHSPSNKVKKEKKKLKKEYCEICQVHYGSGEAHFKKESHRKFMENAKNYAAVENLSLTFPTVQDFLDKYTHEEEPKKDDIGSNIQLFDGPIYMETNSNEKVNNHLDENLVADDNCITEAYNLDGDFISSSCSCPSSPLPFLENHVNIDLISFSQKNKPVQRVFESQSVLNQPSLFLEQNPLMADLSAYANVLEKPYSGYPNMISNYDSHMSLGCGKQIQNATSIQNFITNTLPLGEIPTNTLDYSTQYLTSANQYVSGNDALSQSYMDSFAPLDLSYQRNAMDLSNVSGRNVDVTKIATDNVPNCAVDVLNNSNVDASDCIIDVSNITAGNGLNCVLDANSYVLNDMSGCIVDVVHTNNDSTYEIEVAAIPDNVPVPTMSKDVNEFSCDISKEVFLLANSVNVKDQENSENCNIGNTDSGTESYSSESDSDVENINKIVVSCIEEVDKDLENEIPVAPENYRNVLVFSCPHVISNNSVEVLNKSSKADLPEKYPALTAESSLKLLELNKRIEISDAYNVCKRPMLDVTPPAKRMRFQAESPDVDYQISKKLTAPNVDNFKLLPMMSVDPINKRMCFHRRNSAWVGDHTLLPFVNKFGDTYVLKSCVTEPGTSLPESRKLSANDEQSAVKELCEFHLSPTSELQYNGGSSNQSIKLLDVDKPRECAALKPPVVDLPMGLSSGSVVEPNTIQELSVLIPQSIYPTPHNSGKFAMLPMDDSKRETIVSKADDFNGPGLLSIVENSGQLEPVTGSYVETSGCPLMHGTDDLNQPPVLESEVISFPSKPAESGRYSYELPGISKDIEIQLEQTETRMCDNVSCEISNTLHDCQVLNSYNVQGPDIKVAFKALQISGISSAGICSDDVYIVLDEASDVDHCETYFSPNVICFKLENENSKQDQMDCTWTAVSSNDVEMDIGVDNREIGNDEDLNEVQSCANSIMNDVNAIGINNVDSISNEEVELCLVDDAEVIVASHVSTNRDSYEEVENSGFVVKDEAIPAAWQDLESDEDSYEVVECCQSSVVNDDEVIDRTSEISNCSENESKIENHVEASYLVIENHVEASSLEIENHVEGSSLEIENHVEGSPLEIRNHVEVSSEFTDVKSSDYLKYGQICDREIKIIVRKLNILDYAPFNKMCKSEDFDESCDSQCFSTATSKTKNTNVEACGTFSPHIPNTTVARNELTEENIQDKEIIVINNVKPELSGVVAEVDGTKTSESDSFEMYSSDSMTKVNRVKVCNGQSSPTTCSSAGCSCKSSNDSHNNSTSAILSSECNCTDDEFSGYMQENNPTHIVYVNSPEL